MRCLERDPGKRPASMADVAHALRTANEDRITVDAGPTRVEPRRRSRVRLLVGAGVIAIGAAVYVTQRTAPVASPRASVPVVTPDAAVVVPPPPEVVVETPQVEKQPEPKRTKPRPKPRTTSQGETLD
jgi:hypothetical protein